MAANCQGNNGPNEKRKPTFREMVEIFLDITVWGYDQRYWRVETLDELGNQIGPVKFWLR